MNLHTTFGALADSATKVKEVDVASKHFIYFALISAGLQSFALYRAHCRGVEVTFASGVMALIMASIVGVLVGWVGREMGLPEGYINALVAVAGYTGGDVLDEASKALKRKIKALAPKNDDAE